MKQNQDSAMEIEKYLGELNRVVQNVSAEFKASFAKLKLPLKDFNVFDKVPYSIQLNHSPQGYPHTAYLS